MGCLGLLVRVAVGVGVILLGRELLNSLENPLIGIAVILIGAGIVSFDLLKALLGILFR